MGEIAHLYARSIRSTTNLANSRMKKLPVNRLRFPSGTFVPFVVQTLFPRELLFYNYESPPHFVHHHREVYGQQRLLRIDHHIRRRSHGHSAEPHRLAQAPLHAVALDRAAQRAPHRKSNAHAGNRASLPARGLIFRPLPIKRGQRRRKMTPPQLVNALEIGVPQQPRAARKGRSAGSRLDPSVRFSSFRFSGHTGSHRDSKIPDRYFQVTGTTAGARTLPSAPLDYSRKPGFTETRLRPLARRREITFLPPWVFMRTRNPCVFDRLRRLGWNVRLGMKSSCS
jgi:hypothetical protein